MKSSFKGLLHPKIKNIVIIHLPACRSNSKNKKLCSSSEHNLRFFSPIDCHVINTVKVQKSMKSTAREVNSPAVVQSEFYEANRILFVRKKKLNNDFFSTIRLSSAA